MQEANNNESFLYVNDRLVFPQTLLPNVFRAANYLTRDREAAQDVTQKTFTRALQSFQRRISGANCRARLVTICVISITTGGINQDDSKLAEVAEERNRGECRLRAADSGKDKRRGDFAGTRKFAAAVPESGRPDRCRGIFPRRNESSAQKNESSARILKSKLTRLKRNMLSLDETANDFERSGINAGADGIHMLPKQMRNNFESKNYFRTKHCFNCHGNHRRGRANSFGSYRRSR